MSDGPRFRDRVGTGMTLAAAMTFSAEARLKAKPD